MVSSYTGGMPFLEPLRNQLAVVWALVANTWWLWLPVVLFFAGRELWRVYLRVRYFTFLKWVLLEVRIPREMVKTPEAMEQVFAGLQTLYFPFEFNEVWWQGLQHDYLIFEMVSLGGETRFFIRAPVAFRNAVEAQIYAQYPEAEVREVDDYMKLLPGAVPSADWELFGVEFKLAKEDAYPIRTYRDFMSLAPGQKEPEKVDPFSSIAELSGRIRPGEYLAYHILLRPAQTPTPDAWREAGEKLVSKLIGRKEEPKKGKIAKALEPLEPVTKGWGEPLRPLFGLEPAAAPVKREARVEPSQMQYLSPGTKDIVAAVERNILKPGFEVVIRFTYIARRDLFTFAHLAAFIGALKQFSTLTLNAFSLNGKAMATAVPWWWPPFLKRRRKAVKQRLFYDYFRARKPFVDTWWWNGLRSKVPLVLNSEELATIFHFPGTTTRAPLMPRLEARRGEPPAILPVG